MQRIAATEATALAAEDTNTGALRRHDAIDLLRRLGDPDPSMSIGAIAPASTPRRETSAQAPPDPIASQRRANGDGFTVALGAGWEEADATGARMFGHDCRVDAREVATSSLVQSLLAPDVHVHGMNMLSFGVGVELARASFRAATHVRERPLRYPFDVVVLFGVGAAVGAAE